MSNQEKIRMNVIKRSGEEVEFHAEKIAEAVRKASDATAAGKQMSAEQIQAVTAAVAAKCEALNRAVAVEEIQDMVETEIMAAKAYAVAHNYITYRYERALVRKSNTTDEQIMSLIERNNELVKEENSNKNPIVNSVQRDYMAGEVSKDITNRFLLPKDVVEAHKLGIIHFHDADYYAQHMHNCDLINLEDMLQNGTVISGTHIDKPHSFATACNIATQIIAQVASNQYGGQSITLSHLAPFVDISRQKHRRNVAKELADAGVEVSQDKINRIAEERVRLEIRTGVQTIQYQVITLMTTNGQAPFVTVFMYLDEVPAGQVREDLAIIIEEMLNQRILGVKNEKGVYITPAFPKLIYALDEDNINEDSKYYYLTELAAKCTAKRMTPDYISVKIMKELKGDVYPCMGCRSFLTPDRFTDKGIGNIAEAGSYHPGEHKYYGRFNQGVVTINLVDAACSSKGDMTAFWKIMDERLDLCRRALMCRHERLKGTPSDVAPILWQDGALARLKKGETIDKLLYNGYSTISLGYAGLAECVYYMMGESHTSPEGEKFGLEVMQHLNDACAAWKKETNIDFSVYGTPMESTTYKFAKCLQQRFGLIKGVTDKNYITNSYHVRVTEEIDAFDKLTLESRFQKLSPGGAVSYVEVPNLQNNIPAVLALMKHIYNTIMYAELNTKSDYCQVCGFDGEIKIVKDKNGKLVWECPNCGNRDQSKLNVARRTCGYIGTQFWNQGRTQEIQERVMHL
jgi:ribonucleoside-triphosphate reductase